MLLEVKQASDTRARREVVAQMLDYAANGVAYWPIERIVQAYRETATRAGLEPELHLAEFLDDADPETFWRAVEACGGAGHRGGAVHQQHRDAHSGLAADRADRPGPDLMVALFRRDASN